MPSPFPGMNPYLEDPDLWSSVHPNLIVQLQDALVPQLRGKGKYFLRVELRVFEATFEEAGLVAVGDVSVTHERESTNGVGGRSGGGAAVAIEAASQSGLMIAHLPPRVEVRERALHIHRRDTRELVTVIEILSPTNKRRGKGRQQYEEKRDALADARVHLVEIDLLRDGEPLPVWYGDGLLPRAALGDYRVFIVRAPRRGGELFTRTVREPLPVVPIPLLPADDDISLDLQQAIHVIYDRAAFDSEINYRQEPVPPLSPEDAAWADQLLREQGLR